YLLTVGGLLVLARRSGERPRGAGYPWLQLAYLVLVAALVVDLLVTKPAYTWGSVAVVASGVPFYALWTAAERGSFRSPRRVSAHAARGGCRAGVGLGASEARSARALDGPPDGVR